MTDLLDLTGHLPEIELASGEVLVREGTQTGSVWVLVAGSLDVHKDGVRITTIDRPGAAIGEVAVLRGSGHTATVVASERCRLRVAHDGRELLFDDPAVLEAVASGLAERLELVTGYLADLRNQYAGMPGLDMVSDVIGRLVRQDPAELRPGSVREPDPEY